MNIEAFRFPPDWELCYISDAYTFTKKPRGLNLKKKGDKIPFFAMNQIPIGRV